MARMSAENRAASTYRSGAKWPEPPRGIGRAAAKVWRSVVETRPPDYFRGNLAQLEIYCRAMAQCGRLLDEVERSRSGSARWAALLKSLDILSHVTVAHGRQLRIPVLSSVHAKAGILAEKPSNGLAGDRLIGGHSIKH